MQTTKKTPSEYVWDGRLSQSYRRRSGGARQLTRGEPPAPAAAPTAPSSETTRERRTPPLWYDMLRGRASTAAEQVTRVEKLTSASDKVSYQQHGGRVAGGCFTQRTARATLVRYRRPKR